MSEPAAFLTTPLPQWLRSVAQRSATQQDRAAQQARVYGALYTLSTHPEVAPAWEIVLEDLVQTVLLRTATDAQELALLEGQRQIVLRLLLAGQQAPERMTLGGER